MARLKITLTVVKAMDAVAEWVLCISCFVNLYIKLIVQCLIECQRKYSRIVVTVSQVVVFEETVCYRLQPVFL
jgi:hypothetical protein